MGGKWDAREQPLSWVTFKATSEASGTFKPDPRSMPLTGPQLWRLPTQATLPLLASACTRPSWAEHPTDHIPQTRSQNRLTTHEGTFPDQFLEADMGSPIVIFAHYRG